MKHQRSETSQSSRSDSDDTDANTSENGSIGQTVEKAKADSLAFQS